VICTFMILTVHLLVIIKNLSADVVSGVKNLNTCVLDLCVVSVGCVHGSFYGFKFVGWSRFYF
jgi:hypothetical protein